jgi:predicted PurR-regulated permease PerM
MDLLVLILILLSGYIIKYLIDTINSLNNEIREIKLKCISTHNDVKFNDNSNTKATKTTTISNANATDTTMANAESAASAAASAALIKNITYFKDYFDNV